MSLTDGTVGALPGFEKMVIDGTPWAAEPFIEANGMTVAPGGLQAVPVGTKEFRHVVTGESRPIVAPGPGEELRCVPDWCVGRTGTKDRRYFLRRSDGTHRTELPPVEPGYAAIWAGDDAFLWSGKVFLDPDNGRIGSPVPAAAAKCGLSFQQIGDRIVVDWDGTDGERRCPPGRVFLATTD